MTETPDPQNLIPAAMAGVAASLVLAASAPMHRPWRVILAQTAATTVLAFVIYYGAVGLPSWLGGPLNPSFAWALGTAGGVMGWEAALRWLRTKMGQ